MSFCSPAPPVGIHGPIIGVTDGSNAASGDVGEYIQLTATGNYGAYPSVTNIVISMGVLGPGDWLCFLTGAPQTDIGTWSFYLDPVPSGFSNGMGAAAGSFASTTAFESVSNLTGQPARASLSIPTMIPVRLKVDQEAAAALTAGVANFWFQAWRMR